MVGLRAAMYYSQGSSVEIAAEGFFLFHGGCTLAHLSEAVDVVGVGRAQLVSVFFFALVRRHQLRVGIGSVIVQCIILLRRSLEQRRLAD